MSVETPGNSARMNKMQGSPLDGQFTLNIRIPGCYLLLSPGLNLEAWRGRLNEKLSSLIGGPGGMPVRGFLLRFAEVR